MKKADKKRYVVTPDWEEMIKIKNVAKFLFLYLTIDFWNSVLLSSVDSVMAHMYIKVANIDCKHVSEEGIANHVQIVQFLN